MPGVENFWFLGPVGAMLSNCTLRSARTWRWARVRPRSGSATNRGRCSHPNLVWAALPLRPDMIFGSADPDFADHSAFAPANWTTLAHFSASLAMSLPKSLASVVRPTSRIPLERATAAVHNSVEFQI